MFMNAPNDNVQRYTGWVSTKRHGGAREKRDESERERERERERRRGKEERWRNRQTDRESIYMHIVLGGTCTCISDLQCVWMHKFGIWESAVSHMHGIKESIIAKNS